MQAEFELFCLAGGGFANKGRMSDIIIPALVKLFEVRGGGKEKKGKEN